MLSNSLLSQLVSGLLLVCICFFLGCGSDPTTPKGSKDNTKDKDGNTKKEKSAVEKYVEAALALHEEEKQELAYYALLQAKVFDVQKAKIEQALQSIDAAEYSSTDSDKELPYLGELGMHLNTEPKKLAAKIKTDGKSDGIEVKMLQNDKLVGDARATIINGGSTKYFVFLRPNKLTVDEIQSAFGKPRAEDTAPTGTRFLYYGRFVLVQPADSKIPYVLRFDTSKPKE